MKNEESAPVQVQEDSAFMTAMVEVNQKIKETTATMNEENSKGMAVFFVAVHDLEPDNDEGHVRSSVAVMGDGSALYQGIVDVCMDKPELARMFISAGRSALAQQAGGGLLNALRLANSSKQ